MYYDIIFRRLTTVDREITARCIALLNRADPEVLTSMQYDIDHCNPTKSENYKLAKELDQQLINNTREVIGHPPVYKDGSDLCLPKRDLSLSTFSSSHVPDGSSYGSHC
jgi:fatty acid synthase subunit alpha